MWKKLKSEPALRSQGTEPDGEGRGEIMEGRSNKIGSEALLVKGVSGL